MTVEEISKFAAMEQWPEETLTCPERCFFYALRDIYRDHRSKVIDRETGELRKAEATRLFEKDTVALKRSDTVYAQHAEMWKGIELAGTAYRKNPCVETADLFLKAVYGVGRKADMSKRTEEI